MKILRIVGWVFIPYIMIFISWKSLNRDKKVFGIIWAVLLLIIFVPTNGEDSSTSRVKNESNIKKKENNTKVETAQLKPVTLYSGALLNTIEALSKKSTNRNEKYKEYETTLVGLTPSREEMMAHFEIILKNYKSLTNKTLKSSSEQKILKTIYSARVVELFYVSTKDKTNPKSEFAQYMFQVYRDGYRGDLKRDDFDSKKGKLDKAFYNFDPASVKKRKDREEEEAARKKTIESCFSAWDGSHLNLASYVKDNMNDPDSYEHDKTVYWDRKDHLIVSMTFRGKNAFGGVVKNTVQAKVLVDDQCSLTEILGAQ